MARKWIVDHSREAIGRVWTREDHDHLESTIRKVDRTAEQMAARKLGVTEADMPTLCKVRAAEALDTKLAAFLKFAKRGDA